MTDPIAAARERLATLIYKTKPFLTGRQAKEIADAILAAFPQIAASAQSAMEEARAALGIDRPRREYRGWGNEAHAREANMQIGAARAALEGRVGHVATAITATEARVREECARIAKEWCDAHGWPENIAAAIRAGGGR